MSAPRVIVAGNVTIDDVIYPDGRVRLGQLGGNAVSPRSGPGSPARPPRS
jgi:hypothetical protein